MTEHAGTVTFQGRPLTLGGDLPEEGRPVADAALAAVRALL